MEEQIILITTKPKQWNQPEDWHETQCEDLLAKIEPLDLVEIKSIETATISELILNEDLSDVLKILIEEYGYKEVEDNLAGES